MYIHLKPAAWEIPLCSFSLEREHKLIAQPPYLKTLEKEEQPK